MERERKKGAILKEFVREAWRFNVTFTLNYAKNKRQLENLFIFYQPMQ